MREAGIEVLHGRNYDKNGNWKLGEAADERLEREFCEGQRSDLLHVMPPSHQTKVHWDLIYDGGKRYTNDSFNSTWTVTFPDSPRPASRNTR